MIRLIKSLGFRPWRKWRRQLSNQSQEKPKWQKRTYSSKM